MKKKNIKIELTEEELESVLYATREELNWHELSYYITFKKKENELVKIYKSAVKKLEVQYKLLKEEK